MSDETFEVVRMYDPEIQAHNSAAVLGEYSVHRDISKLEIPPACRPVIFKCRLLNRKSRRAYTDQTTPERKYETAFRFGVLEIRDLPGPGGHLRTWAPSRGKPFDPITDEALDSTGLSDTDIWEVGVAIAARSFLPLGTPLSCPQLDSSVRAWVAVQSLLAEQSQDTETPPND